MESVEYDQYLLIFLSARLREVLRVSGKSKNSPVKNSICLDPRIHKLYRSEYSLEGL